MEMKTIISELIEKLYEEKADFYSYLELMDECEDSAKKATFHRIATEEMGHYKALHDMIFTSAETPFEKAFKEESAKCYEQMLKKVQNK